MCPGCFFILSNIGPNPIQTLPGRPLTQQFGRSANLAVPQLNNSANQQLYNSDNSANQQLSISATPQFSNSDNSATPTTPQLHNSTTQQINNLAISQLHNSATPQLHNSTTSPRNSAIQQLRQLHNSDNSAIQQFSNSAIQQFSKFRNSDNSAIQQLSNSSTHQINKSAQLHNSTTPTTSTTSTIYRLLLTTTLFVTAGNPSALTRIRYMPLAKVERSISSFPLIDSMPDVRSNLP